MKIHISTVVIGNYQDVYENFDKNLFIYLIPPFPPARLKRFDGSKKDDIVEIEINRLFNRFVWRSVISEEVNTEFENYFIDIGIQIPFPLKSWQHKHRVIKVDEQTSRINDEIDFSTNHQLFDWAFYPILYLMFWQRKSRYKKYFNNLQENL